MKKSIWKLLALFFAIAVCFLFTMPIRAFAAASGECGKEGSALTWTLDDNGTLTISGDGEMYSGYDPYTEGQEPPWYTYRGKITKIVFAGNVTSISPKAFVDCYNLTDITVPKTVTYIGWNSFAYCDRLKEINVAAGNPTYHSIDGVVFQKMTDRTFLYIYPDGRTESSYTIPDGVYGTNFATFGSELLSITIPNSVKYIDNYTFYYSDYLKDVYYAGTQSEWDAIDKNEYDNDSLMKAALHFICKEHTWNTTYTTDKPATCTETGSKSIHCKNCIATKNTQVIPAAGHSPAGSYTVDTAATYAAAGSKSKHCTKCGKIVPGTAVSIHKLTVPAAAIKKLTKAKKAFTVKWKKKSGVTGYQIQYGLKSSFKGAKKVTIKKASTTSKKISKLKAKKKYYVRIRSYKTVDGKKYYSTWSKKKTVKTK